MINVSGNPANYPANVQVPAVGDAPVPAILGQQGVDLADRTAWLKANAVKPVISQFTTGSLQTYTLPANCVRLQFVVVGAGQAGQNGSANQGGSGGQAGEITEGELIGTLPASLLYTVNTPGASNGAAGGHAFIRDAANSYTVAFAAGGGSTPTGSPADIGISGAPLDLPNGAGAGGGGTGVAGSNGRTSRRGVGGGGGGTNVGGAGGRGYGAGGGGGRQSSGTTSGGGGGGGGYGVDALANGATGTPTGAPGAAGLVRFIAWVTGI